MGEERVVYGEESLHSHGQCAVNAAHESDVGHGEEDEHGVGRVLLVEVGEELGDGEHQDRTEHVELRWKK